MGFVDQMKRIHQEAESALWQVQETMKRNYDRKKGDRVWLEWTNILTDRPAKKLDNKRHGPFKIVKKVGTASYKLKLPTTWKKIHPVFNEVYLSPYSPPKYPSQKQPDPPPPIIVEGFKEYEIEELMDSRLQHGKLQYLIKWKGYSNRTDWTWEPENKILQDNHDEFYEKHPGAPRWILVRLNFQKLKQDRTYGLDPWKIKSTIATCQLESLSPLWDTSDGLYSTAQTRVLRGNGNSKKNLRIQELLPAGD